MTNTARHLTAILVGLLTAGLAAPQATAGPPPEPEPMIPATASGFVPGWSSTQPTEVGWSAQRSVAITPNGGKALVLADDGVRTLNIRANPATVTGHNGSVTGYAMALRPKGDIGYVGNGSSIYVVNHGGNRIKLVRSMNGVLPSTANDFAVSANGKWLYVAYGGWTGTYGLRVYSLAKPAKPRRVAQLKTGPSPDEVAINAKGNRLAIGYGLVGGVQLYRTDVPKKPRKYGREIAVPQDNDVTGLAFNKSGSRLLVAADAFDGIHVVSWKRRAVQRSRSYSGLGTTGEGGTGVTIDTARNRVALSLWGQTDAVTLIIANAKTLAPLAAYSGVLYPTTPAVSTAGGSKGRIYVSTSNWFDEIQALFVGAIPPS